MRTGVLLPGEVWNQRWHALHRRLAWKSGSGAAKGIAGIGRDDAGGESWLERARARARVVNGREFDSPT